MKPPPCTCTSGRKCATCLFKMWPTKKGVSPKMQPDPLYMLMKNMTQRAHGPRPYDGILSAGQEKVVAYEGDDAGTLDAAVKEATSWMLSSGTYSDGDKGVLIEIRVVADLEHLGDNHIAITERATADAAA